MNDDDDTPANRPLRSPASDAALRLAQAALLLNAIANEFAKAGGRIDSLAADERRLFVRRVADAARQTVRSLSALTEDIDE